MAEKTLYGSTTGLPWGCGVQTFGEFSLQSWEYQWGKKRNPLMEHPHAQNGIGAGIKLACFIDNPECKLAYEELAKKFQIVFQSEVRYNRNSGNMFFMCVYYEKT